MSEPLTPEQEQDIRERAVYVRDLGVDADEYEIEVLAGTDVPALLAELDRTRAEMERRTRMLQASRDEAARLRAELEAQPRRGVPGDGRPDLAARPTPRRYVAPGRSGPRRPSHGGRRRRGG